MGWTMEEIQELERQEQEYQKMPRLVTRGHLKEDNPPHPKQKTKIDTLSITCEEQIPIIRDLIKLSTDEKLEFTFQNRARNAYNYSFVATIDNQQVCSIFFGAKNKHQNSRPQIHIEGRQCHFFDFRKFHHYIQILNEPRITRIDIAIDFFDDTLTIEHIEQAHNNSEFKLPRSINPRIEPIGQIQPDGTNPGRTLYIGSKKSSKFVRFYEKGYQYFDFNKVEEICQNWSSNMDDNPIPDELDLYMSLTKGDRSVYRPELNNDEPFFPKDWIRAELQLRNTNSIIPMNAIIDTDDFFAGSYPFCKGLIMNETTQKRILEKDINIEVLDLKKRISNHKNISGRLINDLKLIGWSDSQIVQYLIDSKGPSQQLIKSGIPFSS